MQKSAAIFIHGFMGHPCEHKQLMTKFKDWGYTPFGIILSGHDKKTLKNVTKEDWKKDCTDYIEEIIQKGYTNIIIVGHSMGALLGIYLTLKYKKYISKLILMDPALEYLKMKNGKLLIFKSLIKLPKVFYHIMKCDKLSPTKMCTLKSLNEFHKLNKEIRDDIYKIKCPILFIHGEKDMIVPITKIKTIYDSLKIKHKTFITIKNGTHWFIHSKIDDKYIKEIEKFINYKVN